MSDLRMRILVVEDDPALAAGLVRGLRHAGFEVELAVDGQRGVEAALASSFQAIVLDVMLPGMNGFQVLESLRGRLSTPVFMLSAVADLDARLRSFDLGAVDFVPKPFWMEELVARLNARLRPCDTAPTRLLEWPPLGIDLDARVVRIDGEGVDLTQHEFNVLAWLVERRGRAVSRRQLAEGALPVTGDRSDRTVDSHIARIRKKLGPHAAQFLVTVWGIGYRFDPPEAAS